MLDNIESVVYRTFPVPAVRKERPEWDLNLLRKTPRVFEANMPEYEAVAKGIRPVFFEGLPYQGRATRVFAWMGIPENTDEPVPGIVLVHGGGGTAFHDWVKLWLDRGYAAIAIDTTGCVPESAQKMVVPHDRHEHAGPDFEGGVFSRAHEPVADQWVYHAVADTILAHSLLASQTGVDEKRIGITGVSWGGVITEITIGMDDRFCFAAPVYGCGHLGDNSYWLETVFQELPEERVERWIELWDPSQYLGQAKLSLLFCNGTNDKHFRPDSWQRTYREVPGPVALTMKIRMEHDHPPAGDPAEILVFAESIVRGGKPLPVLKTQGGTESIAWVRWEQGVPVLSVELVYTTDGGNWFHREWRSLSAEIDSAELRAEVSIPEGATAYYFNLKDERGCLVSSEHMELRS